MKLKSNIFITADSKGSKINAEDRDIIIVLNGEKLPTKLSDIFKHLEFDLGEIYGNSLLSYYTPQEDGSLAVEGSKVQLMDAKTEELILIKGFEKPGIHDDGPISFEHIKQFAQYFKIFKPEEVFKDLTVEEKQAFISEREAAYATSAEPQPDKEKEAEELKEKQRALDELKASLDPQYVHDKQSYYTTQTYYNSVKFKEYVEGPYHLFYGLDPDPDPCVMIKRNAEWWEEIKQENLEILDKTDTTLALRFKDGETLKTATLQLETGKLIITDSE